MLTSQRCDLPAIIKSTTIVFSAVGVLALHGCGDSGGGGTNTGGAAAAGGSGGASAGGSAADGGAATGGGGGALGGAGGGYECPPDQTDDPCTACIRASCCDVFSECVQDPVCAGCYECLTSTPPQQQQACFDDGTCPVSGSMVTDQFQFCRQDCSNNGCG